MISSKVLLEIVFIWITIQQSGSNNEFLINCDKAPTDAIRQAYLRSQNLTTRTRRQIHQLNSFSTMEAMERSEAKNNPYECMTLSCLCPHFQGQSYARNECILSNGERLRMAVRKEYRLLSDDERRRWHKVLNILKRNGEFDRLSAQHQEVGIGSGAHSGPGFLPWHREYLKRFEIAVRLLDPSLAIPYWDSVLDHYLPDPRDSILFTPMFLGETDQYGNVVTGPFAYWRCLDGRPAIWRNMAKEGSLFSERNINQVMAQTDIEFVLAYTAPLPDCPVPNNFYALEYAHSNIHLWVGGHMKPPSSSSNDPIFFMLHSFVDFIWEMWRRVRQPRWMRNTAYSRDLPQCTDPQHFSYAFMRPFYNLRNRDGLSNMYTDFMYGYAPRPTCSKQNPECNSPYLFCDSRGHPHCVSKIKFGGYCTGFEGFDACYNGVCLRGYCSPGVFKPTSPKRQLKQNQLNIWSVLENDKKPFRSDHDELTTNLRRQEFDYEQENEDLHSRLNSDTESLVFGCYNRNPCCDAWSRKGFCKSNGARVRRYCAVACGLCQPSFDVNNECIDRHPTCNIWQKAGECQGNSSHFMAENCRMSCNLCDESKSNSCPNFDEERFFRKQRTRAALMIRNRHPVDSFDLLKHENINKSRRYGNFTAISLN